MNPFLPDKICETICDLTPEILSNCGIEVLLMDYDNTIVPYTTDAPAQAVMNWFSEIKNAGIRVCIVSNTKRGRAVKFCSEQGLDCITRAKKPFQRGIRIAKKRYERHIGHIALVGDQIYTDVLGANLGGLFSILVRPIHLHNIWLKLRHIGELPWIALRKRRNAK